MSFTLTPNKPTCKPKYVLPTRRGKNGSTEIYMTEEQEKEFIRLFPATSNIRLMKLFGISFSTLQRFKRRLGLTKNMPVIRKKQAKATVIKLRKSGYYDTMKGRRPSDACIEAAKRMRAEGFCPIAQLKKTNPRKYKKYIEQKREARLELIHKERRRVELGLTPKTNLRCVRIQKPYSRSDINRRYWALQRGYILGDIDTERYLIFYDDETNRSALFEKRCRENGFTIKLLLPDTQEVSFRPYSNNESLNTIFL